MLVQLCLLLFVTSVLSCPVRNVHLDAQFEEWKRKFEKVYSGPEEEAMRRALWEQSLRDVEKHNREAELGLHTFTLGINQFSDMVSYRRGLDVSFCRSEDDEYLSPCL
uniref:Cathepsin propeptide inhibitor domain-containing protein n=1 Tax=Periophthalmus magnuspinnatus TaxID=409849 RepID=A0A3B3ZR97_9GOBI